MNYSYFDLAHQQDLPAGVKIKKLTIHKDPTGVLFETLRTDWPDVYNVQDLHFAMQYMSVTPPGVARDEDQWHVHKNQTDRFICASGRIVTAVFDPRPKSPTNGKLNLFTMGPGSDDEMYMVVIPPDVYHGFMVISPEPGHLLNFPTQLYNTEDEGRVDHNHDFSWQNVREDFGI